MRHHLVRAAAAASLLALILSSVVLAGGWATIVPDEGSAEPVAGEPFRLGFVVLQHGETPAGWVHAQLVATNAVTGERLTAAAQASGADGHFTATLTYPEAGFWTWSVVLAELETETVPAVQTVRFPDGRAPTIDDATLLAAIAQARRDVTAELRDQVFAADDAMGARVDTLRNEVARLTDQRDALEARVDGLANGGIPPVAVIALAVLAGAISGFAITLLGRGGAARRAEPREIPVAPATTVQPKAVSRSVTAR